MGLLTAAGWGALAAFSLVVGAWLAYRPRPVPPTRVGMVMGFGSGALLAAIAYELVPTGFHQDVLLFSAFGLGAVVFFFADALVAGRRTMGAASAERSLVIGTLLDGVPESMVLGIGVAMGGEVAVAFLVAVFVSNLPESIGATAAMREHGHTRAQTYRMWWLIVAVSALAAAIGFLLYHVVPRADGGYVEAFAAGAVLTMLADSMIPEAYRQGGKATGLLAVLGFAVAGALSALQ
ncbi:ZIP family metal transporter [Catellatospora methionotrophica]|uniref:ZIP family metal transporter n=1 Tax=Catellatospora methionotrophica TaxID=121620 RepID=UPI0033CFECFD